MTDILNKIMEQEKEKHEKFDYKDERWNKIFNDLICPDCGSKLNDNRIQHGSRMGGFIDCSKCAEVKVIM